MVLAEIGEQMFSIALWIAIILTIFALVLASSGITLPSPINELTIPISMTYKYAKQLIQSPTNIPQFTSSNIVSLLNGLVEAGHFAIGVAVAVAGIAINFAMLLMGIFVILAYVIYIMLPPTVSFLALPLFFVGSFLQLCIYVYVYNKLKESISNINVIPFKV